MTAQLNEPGINQRDATLIVAHGDQLSRTQAELERACARWESLESG